MTRRLLGRSAECVLDHHICGLGRRDGEEDGFASEHSYYLFLMSMFMREN